MEDILLKSKNGTHISTLFPEILAMIFQYLDIKDKGRVSQVCLSWRDACYNRMVWRNVEAKLHLRRANPSLFPSLCRRGIKRVQILSLRRSLRDVVFGIPNLESLNLSGCFNVTDASLGHAFSQDISSMTVLNLSLCKQVTDNSLVRIAQYLKNLEVLELGGCCHITNVGLSLIACSLRNLKQLNLRSCRHVSDQGIGHLAGLSPPASASSRTESLKFRNLDQGTGHFSSMSQSAFVNTKTDDGKEETGNARLEYLGLQDCQKLTDHALRHVSVGLCHLKTINLSFCGSVTDSGIKFLSKMTNLRELNLRSCDNISDTGLGFLAEGGGSTIEALDVSFCDKVGDQGLAFLSQGMYSLRRLSLSACNISDDGIQKLANSLHELTTLNIGQCGRITDVSLSAIGEKLKQLKSIDLYGCTRITTVGLEKIMKLPGLTTLNLGLWHKR